MREALSSREFTDEEEQRGAAALIAQANSAPFAAEDLERKIRCNVTGTDGSFFSHRNHCTGGLKLRNEVAGGKMEDGPSLSKERRAGPVHRL